MVKISQAFLGSALNSTRQQRWLGPVIALLLTACIRTELPPTSRLTWQAANQGLAPHAWITTIAVDPNSPQHIYAGSYGRDSLYTSIDGGVTWQRVGTGVNSQPLFKLLADPWRAKVMWAGTADGLYRGAFDNTPGQAQWKRVGVWPPAAAVYDLVYDLGVGTTLYAAGEDRSIWTSMDGENWQPLAPLPEAVGAILAVAVSDGVLLARSDGAGLFASRDHGQSWQKVATIGDTFVAALWVAPWNNQLILARTRAGLFRSIDGSATWQIIASELEDRVDAIAGQSDEHTIFLGMSSGQLYRSTDEGATWHLWGAGVDRDGMFNTLIIGPGTDATFWAGTQYGLYRSQDHASSWQRIATFGTVRATALAQSPDGTLYLGTDDGVAVSTDKGATWQPRSSGLPLRAVLDLEVAPDDASLLYAATEGDGIYVSNNAGNSWAPLAWSNTIIPDLALDPHTPQRLYLRVAYGRIYASDDLGHTWVPRWEGMADTTEIMSFVLSPHQADLLYAGGVVDAFKSEDGANSWQRIAPEMAGQSIFYLSVDAQNPRTVYAGATKGLYRSQDAGTTWRLLGSGLADITVSVLAFDPANPAHIFAGTKYQGVYGSDDGGQSWHSLQSGMGDASVRHLLMGVDGEWLFAATDQGFWRAALP